MRTILPGAIALLLAAPALGQGLDAQAVIRAERAANGACRGGPGDAAETQQACGRRDALGQVLGEIGWCYGRDGESGAAMSWHRCGKGSRRQSLPR